MGMDKHSANIYPNYNVNWRIPRAGAYLASVNLSAGMIISYLTGLYLIISHPQALPALLPPNVSHHVSGMVFTLGCNKSPNARSLRWLHVLGSAFHKSIRAHVLVRVLSCTTMSDVMSTRCRPVYCACLSITECAMGVTDMSLAEHVRPFFRPNGLASDIFKEARPFCATTNTWGGARFRGLAMILSSQRNLAP